MMALLSRLSGNGAGAKWGVSWLPEALFAFLFGLANSYAFFSHGFGFFAVVSSLVFSTLISFAGMQSATWMSLLWESHDDPNTERTATLKPFIDWLAGVFGYRLGDEGYAWTAAAVKGFIIGLPVGGFPCAVLWMLGQEIGSRVKGENQQVFRDLFAGAGAGLSIVLFLAIVGM